MPNPQTPGAIEGLRWSFYVHADEQYVSINDGASGDTLLKIGGQPGRPGAGDVAKVREFESHVARLLSQAPEDELRSEVDVLCGELQRIAEGRMTLDSTEVLTWAEGWLLSLAVGDAGPGNE